MVELECSVEAAASECSPVNGTGVVGNVFWEHDYAAALWAVVTHLWTIRMCPVCGLVQEGFRWESFRV